MVWEQRMYNEDKLIVRDSLDSIAKTVYENQKNFVYELVNNNKSSMASVIALYQVFGRVSVLDEFEYIELYSDVVQSLKEKYGSNQHINELSARVERNKITLQEKEEVYRRLQPGNKVPELSLPNKDGTPTSISQYKGYTILLYFWAGTNPLCRKMNIELAELSKRFTARGFLIYSVSFDTNTDVWTKAIEHDKLQGIHVNDVRGWHSPVVKMFNIDDLPYSILIDKEGTIVQNNPTIQEVEKHLHNILPQRRISTTTDE
jgi:peroxiredoxin